MNISKKELSKRMGNNIRKIRTNRGFTIEKLASEADMEYTQLARIELGQINTSVFQIYKISQALSIDISELFKDLDLEKNLPENQGGFQ